MAEVSFLLVFCLPSKRRYIIYMANGPWNIPYATSIHSVDKFSLLTNFFPPLSITHLSRVW